MEWEIHNSNKNICHHIKNFSYIYFTSLLHIINMNRRQPSYKSLKTINWNRAELYTQAM